eukprot:CCRYP_009696-RE/>CCRYP_009696-RE protein AED:0.45 eAED:0.45 QI:1/1/0.5/1/0/0/2/179/86
MLRRVEEYGCLGVIQVLRTVLGNADFASSPKVMYLSFYWTVSAHLLTVMHQMMLRRVEEYGCLGVIQVVWTVLGWFSNSFLLLWQR